MARITEDLVRKRSEHNNCEITTLEELSLHQQDIEKIEHLDKWCRDLKILYLQSNLIPKIENVARLKKLEYLNLALNNITKIENLKGCESLQKLDLTVNFVDDLLSIESLKHNEHLKEIYLTGNPCTDYYGYREFVIATLPQLQWLDGKEITRSERIQASQKLSELRISIVKQQMEYEQKLERDKEKDNSDCKPGFDGRWYTDPNAHLISQNVEESQKQSPNEMSEAEEERFMKEPISHSPQSRVALHKHIAEKRKDNPKPQGPQQVKRERRLERDGVMLNVNEGKYDFHLEENDNTNQYILEVACPRFMDTSFIDCDVQPTYIRVTIKGKILQLVLQDEISPDQSTAKRSQTTGHLVVTMPKVKGIIKPKEKTKQSIKLPQEVSSSKPLKQVNGTELLDVPEKRTKGLFDIVSYNDEESTKLRDKRDVLSNALNKGHYNKVTELQERESFIDDPNVPPLI